MKYTIDKGTIDTSDTWNGKTGEEVQKIISDALDNTVTDFLIQTEGIDHSKGVGYWILKGGEDKGEKEPDGYISLIEPAQYNFVVGIGTMVNGVLENYELPSFLPAGFGLSIPYTFKCTETGGGELVKIKATIQVIINDVVVPILSQTTVTSTLKGYSVGTINIAESYLLDGKNTIQINFVNTDLGLSVTPRPKETVYYVKEISFDCDIRCGDNDYSNPIGNGDELSFLNFAFNLSTNGKLPDYLLKDGAFKLKAKLNLCAEQTLASGLKNQSLSMASLLGTSSYKPGEQDILVWIEIQNELGNSMKSSYVCYRFFGKGDNYDKSLYVTYKAYFTKINPNYCTEAVQYKNIAYKITLINVTSQPQAYTFGFSGDSLAQDTILGNVSKNLTITKTFEKEGTYTIGLNLVSDSGTSSVFSYEVLVNKDTSIFSFPTNNLLLNLNGSGKVEGQKDPSWTYGNYSTEFYNFDWSGNGWKDSSLVLNQGATAKIDCPVLSNNTYAISFNIDTDGVNGEELISCTNSAKDFGFIIYTDKIKWMYHQGGSIFYTYGSGAHEITIVKYSSTYNNTCILYIDGSIQKIAHTTIQNTLSTPITLTATNDTLKVKNIVAYSRSLSFAEVLALYGYHLSDSLSYFDKNNIFGDNDVTSIGYQGGALKPETLPIGSRYMIIEGTSKQGSDGTIEYANPWETINGYAGAHAEDREKNKGIRHPVNSIKYIVKTKEKQDAHNFYIVGGTISALGTSSMAYPVKNFRIYFKKKIDKSISDYYNTTSIYDPDKDDKKGDAGYSVAAYFGVTEDFKTTTPSIIGKIDTSNVTINDFVVNPIDGSFNGNSVAVTKKTDDNGNETLKAAKVSVSMYHKGDGLDGESYTYASAPVKLFCLKADFAESSGCHNTGFARFADYYLNKTKEDVRGSSEEYKFLKNDGTSIGLPFESNRGSYEYDIRSTVDGIPIYLFFKKSGEDDSEAVYAGKYNMNNDKSSEDVYGFTGISDYYNNETVKTQSAILKTLFNDTENHFENTHYKYKIEGGAYEGCDDGTSPADNANIFVNPNECWEFSNNIFNLESTPTDVNGNTHNERVSIGAFNYPYNDSNYPNLSPFAVKSGSNGKLAWLDQAWEYRFPDLEDWVYTKETTGDLVVEKVADDLYTTGLVVPLLLSSLYEWIYKHNVNFATDKNTTANDFAYYLSDYFHVNYLVKYYLLTKFFGCVDQRIKNAMLSFLCVPDASKTIRESSSYTHPPMGNMRAYFIFYDNDTILGLANDGTLKWPWNLDEGENSTIPYEGTTPSTAYAGAEGASLWDTMEYCLNLYKNGNTTYKYAYLLGECIATAYKQLSELLPSVSSDKKSEFDRYFESICNYFSDSAYNLDSQVKYIYPLKISSSQDSTTDSNYLKEHGNRKPHRRAWIAKRKAWYDNMYQTGDSASYKIAFKLGGVSGTYKAAPVLVTQALPKFKFGLSAGDGNCIFSLLSTSAGEAQSLQLNSVSISDPFNIIGLYAALKVDFSKFYFTQNCPLSSSEMTNALPLQYLASLVFTPDLSTRSNEYQYIDSSAISGLINSTVVPNLKDFDFGFIKPYTGDSFSEINLGDLTKLKTVNTLSTSIISIVLPKGESLEKLVVYNPVNIGYPSTQVENNGITGKAKLTSIKIEDWSRLKNLVIGDGNNEVVYNYILKELSSWAPTTADGENIPKVQINFSQERLYPTKVSDDAINSLIAISKAKTANELKYEIEITGYIYNSSDTASDNQGVLKNAFSDLVLTNEIGKLTLKNGSITTIKEGESVTFVVNDVLPIANWQVLIDNDDYNNSSKPIKEYLIVEYDGTEKASLVKITANDSQNLSFKASSTVKVVVKSTSYDESAPNPDLIAEGSVDVSYVPVESVSIKTLKGKDAIISSGGTCRIYTDSSQAEYNSDIIINVNSSCTKKIENKDILLYVGNKSYTAGDPFGVAYDGFNDSDELYVSINGKNSNTLPLYKDVNLIIPGTTNLLTFTYTNDAPAYYWLSLLRNNYAPNTLEEKISRKFLNENFTLLSKDLADYCFGKKLNDTDCISDLLYLKYCDWSGSFKIPANGSWSGVLAIPDKVTEVVWSQTSFDDSIEYGGKTIVFPRQMTKCNLVLSGIKPSANLHNMTFNFENCKNITSLCGGTHTGINNNYISLDFSYLLSDGSSSYSYGDTGKGIFLPPSIEQIGYYCGDNMSVADTQSDGVSWNTSYAMFKLGNFVPGDSNSAIPMFTIPPTANCKKVGVIYGYNATSSSQESDMALKQLSSDYAKNVLYISHACVKGSGLYKNANISLSKVKVLGDLAFYCAPEMTVTLNSDIELFGASAFRESLVTVKSTTTQNESISLITPIDNSAVTIEKFPETEFLKFAKADSIKRYLFFRHQLGGYFEFASPKISIESFAFAPLGENSFHIYLSAADAEEIVIAADAFGEKKSSYLYVTQQVCEKLKLASTFSDLCKNVNLYVVQ